ncbi:MAG: 30S ribosomal protein S13 [Nanoarchaeota archaeon]|nr:30S ribosomal protein S13 [Nanoarchaeota archaeon]MBU1854841.1 30S ribosomal protein S13 [Nanoarchaeota archaeon]
MSEQEFKYIIRIANTDLSGNKPILYALRKIKGVNIMIANALCGLGNIQKDKKAGNLSPKEAEKLTSLIKEMTTIGVPEWLMNRRKDPETGKDIHLHGPELQFTKDNDIKMFKKTKSYKGLRHQWGIPVRGQRTKSNFRRNKGKGSLGVKRKK